jgi:hypothetical protein
MNNVHPAFALALWFAPPPPADEARRVAADIELNRLKNSGELQRREEARALEEQIKWGDV